MLLRHVIGAALRRIRLDDGRTLREVASSANISMPYLSEIEHLTSGAERAYVCGSVGFASYAQRLLGEAGMRADGIRVEQFGATG